jgi:hypothetical protein
VRGQPGRRHEGFDRRAVIRARFRLGEPDQEGIDVSRNTPLPAVRRTQSRGARPREGIEHDISGFSTFLQYLLDQANRVGGRETQPAVPPMLTILFERQLGVLP